VSHRREAVHDSDGEGILRDMSILDVDHTARHRGADVMADVSVGFKVANSPACSWSMEVPTHGKME
jgi:hypothetical protein